jgi:hypothetical protein
MIPYSQLVHYLVIPIHHKLNITLNTKDHNRITLAEKSPLRSKRPHYKVNLFQYFGKKMNFCIDNVYFYTYENNKLKLML